jgi:nucleotide-binding universal stress UspA family protein
MFRRIVVGVDGSSEGKDAAAFGAAIAAATGSGLTLLRAFTPFLVAAGEGMQRESQVRAAERQLWADRREFAPFAHIEAVADPNPARALLSNAKEWNADLIVIGSTRSALLGRCAVGSTGRLLLTRRPPALAIAQRGWHEHAARLMNIGVGYDGSPESEVALQFADRLAAAAGAELLIETVNRDPIPPLLHGEPSTPTLLQQLRDDAQRGALATARRAAAHAVANSDVEASVGEPGLVLRQVSESVDVMVIGSRRWGTMARVLLDGAGETLVADCGASLIVTSQAQGHSDGPA